LSKIRDSFFKANNFFKDGNFEEAQDLYEEIIKDNPYLIKAWKNLSACHIRLGNFVKAIEIITEALKVEPENASLWRSLGIAYFRAEEYEEAIKIMQKCLEGSPNNEKIWCNIGVAHAQLGNHDEAIKAYKCALDLNDRYFNAWKNICLTYANMGVDFKYDDLKPNTDTAWYLLSKALLIHGLFEDALDACNKALRKNPGFHAAHIFKNKIKSMINEKIEEIQPVKQVTKPTAKNNLIFIGNNYRKIGDCFFVVDGANVAREGLNSSRSGKISNLELLKRKLNSFSISNYLIICDRSLNYTIDDQETYSKMVQNEEVLETPGGTEADYYILQLAKERDAYMISNDMFKEFYNYFGKEWIKSRRITFRIFKQSIFFDKIFTVS
jgi:tetratricopeptide (TPR) repeat protein